MAITGAGAPKSHFVGFCTAEEADFELELRDPAPVRPDRVRNSLSSGRTANVATGHVQMTIDRKWAAKPAVGASPLERLVGRIADDPFRIIHPLR
jgi:hypothetical protein